MKEFIIKNKKKIGQALLILVGLILISVATFLILYLFDVVYFDDGMKFNLVLFDSFKNTWYGWLIFLIIQVLLTTLLCVIPGTSLAFIFLSIALYENVWIAFLLSFVGVILSSSIMYLVGRNGGYKICEKIIGEEECENAMRLIRIKGTVYFPIMMLFPFFPDDALVMVAGTTKMKLSWFIPSIVVGRGIGVASIIFGFSIIPFKEFTSLYDWLILVTVCCFWLIVIFKSAHKLNKYLEKKNTKEVLGEKNDSE